MNFFEILVECVQRISSECDIWLILNHISSIQYKHKINKMWRSWHYIIFLIQTNILSNSFQKENKKISYISPDVLFNISNNILRYVEWFKILSSTPKILNCSIYIFCCNNFIKTENCQWIVVHSSKSLAQDNHCVAASPITIIAIFGIEMTPPAARTTSRLFIIT